MFDELGPMNATVAASWKSMGWFVKQIFRNQEGRPLELLPFQMVMLDMLWKKKFPMILGARGCGKTFILAIYCLLRAILVPGSRIVVCGAGFRQAKLVFKYIHTLYKASPIIQECCDKRPTYASDEAYLDIGLSRISAIPIGDGEKVRGMRATVLILDEFACLDKDTLVETTSGLVRIADFDRLSEDDKLITGNQTLPLEKPAKFIKTPLCDVYEISLSHGHKIKCSKNHRLMTNNGWKTPLQLTEDDYIESINHYEFPRRLLSVDGVVIDNELAWVIGLLTAEASVRNEKIINVNMTDKAVLDRVQYVLSARFPDLKIYRYEQDGCHDPRGFDCKPYFTLRIADVKFRELLHAIGVDHVTAHNKKVAWSILKSPKDVVLAYLDGLFEGDGSAFLFKDKRRDNNIGVAYYSVSERICRDVQILLNKLGYDPTIHDRNSNLSDNRQWFVRLNRYESYDFAKQLHSKRFQERVRECYLPRIPSNITFDRNRNKWKIHKSHLDKRIQKRFDTRLGAEEFLADIPKYRRVLNVRVLPDQDHLYDYYLPLTHSFYADSLRQHNSIPEEIYEVVLAPFAAVHANPSRRVQITSFAARIERLGGSRRLIDAIMNTLDFGNQIVISGTASYKTNHFYKRYRIYQMFVKTQGDKAKLKRAIEEQSLATTGKVKSVDAKDIERMSRTWRQYAIYQLPYHGMPDGFLDEDVIRSNRASYSPTRFMMEYEAKFPDDSDGFIKRSWIELSTPRQTDGEDPVTIELYGDPRATYVMGIDPARHNDNIAAVVLKIVPRGYELVYVSAWNRTAFKESARRIREICKRFNIQYIAMDKGGGGDSILDWLHQKQEGVEEDEYLWPIKEQLDTKADLSAPGRKIVELVNFSSATVELAHGLEAGIRNQHLLFPYKGDDESVRQQYSRHFQLERSLTNVEIEALNNDLWGEDTEEIKNDGERQIGVFEEVNETTNEICAIIRDVTPMGVERFILPNLTDQPEGLDMRRRDRFSALMLANYAAKVFMGHGHRTKHHPGMAVGNAPRKTRLAGKRFRRRGNVLY